MRDAPAVQIATTASDGNTTVLALFIGRDYQGSITHLINEDGTVAAEYSCSLPCEGEVHINREGYTCL